MSVYPFSVFKRARRPNYLVSFKDNNGTYLPPVSTEKEAIDIAFKWLRDGIPQKNVVSNPRNFLFLFPVLA